MFKEIMLIRKPNYKGCW